MSKVVTRADILLAIRIAGRDNPYQIVSWLGAMDYYSPNYTLMEEVREVLGMPRKEIAPEIAGPITSMLDGNKDE